MGLPAVRLHPDLVEPRLERGFLLTGRHRLRQPMSGFPVNGPGSRQRASAIIDHIAVTANGV